MKRFVICLDGTWQQLRQDELTNIALIARSVAHSGRAPDGATIPQIVIYSRGVGAEIHALTEVGTRTKTRLRKVASGVFGEGLEDQIVDVYLQLAFNYEAGDEIFIFGFSRGAFAARSLAGMLALGGVISRRHAEQAWEAFRLYRFRPKEDASAEDKEAHAKAVSQFRLLYGKGRRDQSGERVQTDEAPLIKYLGIFDTVGQRGIPETFGAVARMLNKRYGFHDLKLSPAVLAARHAVAIDENRLGFPPTLWENLDQLNVGGNAGAYQQCWFVGTHGNVGGNGSPLSAAPLKWIAEGAAAAGLALYPTSESPLHTALRNAGLGYDAPIERMSFWDALAPMNYPLAVRRIWIGRAAPDRTAAETLIHFSAAQRAALENLRYRPAPLRPFLRLLAEWAAEAERQ